MLYFQLLTEISFFKFDECFFGQCRVILNPIEIQADGWRTTLSHICEHKSESGQTMFHLGPILGGFILPSWRQDAHQDAKLGEKFGFKPLFNPSWTHLAPNISTNMARRLPPRPPKSLKTSGKTISFCYSTHIPECLQNPPQDLPSPPPA